MKYLSVVVALSVTACAADVPQSANEREKFSIFLGRESDKLEELDDSSFKVYICGSTPDFEPSWFENVIRVGIVAISGALVLKVVWMTAPVSVPALKKAGLVSLGGLGIVAGTPTYSTANDAAQCTTNIGTLIALASTNQSMNLRDAFAIVKTANKSRGHCRQEGQVVIFQHQLPKSCNPGEKCMAVIQDPNEFMKHLVKEFECKNRVWEEKTEEAGP